MNTHFTAPHINSWNRTGRLAVLVTGIAAVAAWFLAAVAHLSEHAVVITVMVVAFAASWAITNHRPAPKHRVTLVRVRERAH